MTPKLIDAEVRNLRGSRSQADLQLGAMAMLAKCILSRNPQGDAYMEGIREFHEKFGLAYNGAPKPLTKAEYDFRVKFLQEELDEYKEGILKGDLEKQFDALIDLLYVTVGTAYLQGFPLMEGFLRVQEANMAKVRATKATATGRDPQFDIVKPDGWTPPNLSDLIVQL